MWWSRGNLDAAEGGGEVIFKHETFVCIAPEGVYMDMNYGQLSIAWTIVHNLWTIVHDYKIVHKLSMLWTIVHAWTIYGQFSNHGQFYGQSMDNLWTILWTIYGKSMDNCP